MADYLSQEERRSRARERWKKAGTKIKAVNRFKSKVETGHVQPDARLGVHYGGGTVHTERSAFNGIESSWRQAGQSRNSPTLVVSSSAQRKQVSQISKEAQRIRAEQSSKNASNCAPNGSTSSREWKKERARKNWKTARAKLKTVQAFKAMGDEHRRKSSLMLANAREGVSKPTTAKLNNFAAPLQGRSDLKRSEKKSEAEQERDRLIAAARRRRAQRERVKSAENEGINGQIMRMQKAWKKTVTVDFECPSRIRPYMFLGDRHDAANRDLLQKLGVSHVLNSAHQLPNYHEGTLPHAKIVAC